MAFTLSDIYIGDFPITQSFGARPEYYHALYGIRGHNGIDIATPSLTPILSTADGWVSEIGSKELGTFDSAGYGTYVKIVHEGYLTLYAHLNDVQVRKGDRVIAGQLIAHSNNSGNSTGPHLHFGVAPCDGAGIKTEIANGSPEYISGYLDPMGAHCEWQIKNLSAPVTSVANQEDEMITIKNSDYTKMVKEGTGYKVMISLLQQYGLNTFLNAQGMESIDFNTNPQDPTGGERANIFLTHLIQELKDANRQLEQARLTPPSTDLEQQVNNLPIEKRQSLLFNLLRSVKGFILK